MNAKLRLAERLYGYFYAVGSRRFQRRLKELEGVLLWPRMVSVGGSVFFYVLRVEKGAMGELALCGVREPYSTGRFVSMISSIRPELHVDVGANFGYYAAMASRFSPVVAFEPLDRITSFLERNLAYNSSFSYRVIEAAVYPNDDGYVNFEVGDKPNLSRVSREGDPVPAVNPEDVVPYVAPWTLRMDIEGSELQVLPGILSQAQSADNLPAYIFVEYHPNLIGAGEVLNMDSYVRSLGYSAFYYFEPVPEVMCSPGWKVLEFLGYVGEWTDEPVLEAARRNWVLHAHYYLPPEMIEGRRPASIRIEAVLPLSL